MLAKTPVKVYRIVPASYQILKTKTKLRLICDNCAKPILIGDYFALKNNGEEFAGFKCEECFNKLIEIIHDN